jgi:hypothetical protein
VPIVPLEFDYGEEGMNGILNPRESPVLITYKDKYAVHTNHYHNNKTPFTLLLNHVRLAIRHAIHVVRALLEFIH